MNTKNNQKKVLGMVLKGYPRISESFISNEILMLEKIGFSIRIFSLRSPREPFTHESVKKIKARVYYLPENISGFLPTLIYHNLLILIKKPQNYIKALKTAFKRFARTRKSATIKHLLQAGYMCNHLLKDKQVAHLHAHFAHSPTSVAMFASIISGLSFTFTAHAKDIYTSCPKQLHEKIALAKFVVTCTKYNKRYLIKMAKGCATPIHCIYHGIDLDFFKQNKTNQLKIPYQLLTVARIIPKKGLPTVYRAIRRLCDKGIPVQHILIGDGDDRNKIERLIKQLRIEHVTRCVGTLPHKEVIKYYKMADLFVIGCEIAFNNDRDGIPNVIAESMAMGKPVVATNVSGIPEIVVHEQTGLLVQQGEYDKMAEAIERLLTQIDFRSQIINNAKQYVTSNFDNKILIKNLAEVFKKNILPDFFSNEKIEH